MRVRLDWHSDATPKAGERAVNTETEWLRVALGNDSILVQGELLCRWAERFCTWRGIPCEEAISPTKRLQEVLKLNTEEARLIVERLGDNLPEPLTAVVLLSALAPQPTLWKESPSKKHAAAWLLWLSEQKDDPVLAPLIRVASREWQKTASAEIRCYYEATCADEARTLLFEWLGIQPSQRVCEPFPIQPPEQWLQEVSDAWRRQLVETNGDAWRSLWNRPLHPSARRKLANILGDFFINRPDKLMAEVLETIGTHLSADVHARLRGMIAPEIPSEPPEEPNALLDWFAREYLPYREWQHLTENTNAQQEVNRLARLFAERLLSYYPQAIVRTDEHLAFVQVNRLVSSPKSKDVVTLVVILDGMAHWDARELKKCLQETLPDLQLVDSRLVFTALPTITEFCKNALFTASPPKYALGGEVTAVGVVIPDRANPAEMLREAPHGSLFFWRVAEPDKTYHERNRDEMLFESIKAELLGVARKLKRVISELPEDYPLQLVITSDHGRLMGRAVRQLISPFGWQAHERAAYLTEGEGRCYEAHGYFVENGLVYLSPVSFGLPCDTVCVLSDEAFLDASGKGGTVAYPHGGLYPEEVIVDWWVYVRQPQPVEIRAILRGKGRPRKPATIELEIHNLSSVALTLVGLQERAGRLSIAMPQMRLNAYSTEKIQVQIDAFPDSPHMLQIDALFRTPSGDLHQSPVEVHLETEAMYQTEPILEDLL